MDTTTQFRFRSKLYLCTFLIDCSYYPCYIFTILADKELVAEFGDELTIKTDGLAILPKRDCHPEVVKLREAMFLAIKETPEFIATKEKIMGLINDVRYGKPRKLVAPVKSNDLSLSIGRWRLNSNARES